MEQFASSRFFDMVDFAKPATPRHSGMSIKAMVPTKHKQPNEQAVQRQHAEQAVQRQAQDGSPQHRRQGREEQPPPEPAGLPIVFFQRLQCCKFFQPVFFCRGTINIEKNKFDQFFQLQIYPRPFKENNK